MIFTLQDYSKMKYANVIKYCKIPHKIAHNY